MRKCIVYCNNKQKTLWLYRQIKMCDFTVSVVHSDLSENELKESLNGNANVLVSMDLERVSAESLIINYDLAKDKKLYLFRNGSFNHKKGIVDHKLCVR